MIKLRGQYTILTANEIQSKKPDTAKIEALRKRRMEISLLMRSLPYTTIDVKEKAIDEFVLEFKKLKPQV